MAFRNKASLRETNILEHLQIQDSWPIVVISNINNANGTCKLAKCHK